jgi:hypothetical protein
MVARPRENPGPTWPPVRDDRHPAPLTVSRNRPLSGARRLLHRLLDAGLGEPPLPGHHLESQAVVVDQQIAVAAARHRGRHDGLHLLGHHADIGGVIVTLVAEAIEADAVVQLADLDDVLLEIDVGVPPAPVATPAPGIALAGQLAAFVACAQQGA